MGLACCRPSLCSLVEHGRPSHPGPRGTAPLPVALPACSAGRHHGPPCAVTRVFPALLPEPFLPIATASCRAWHTEGLSPACRAFALANRHPHAMRCPAQQASPGLGSKGLEPGCSHVHDSQMAPPPPPTPIPLDLSADCAQRPVPALTCPPKGLRPSAGLIAPESWRGQSDANRPRHTPKWDRVC